MSAKGAVFDVANVASEQSDLIVPKSPFFITDNTNNVRADVQRDLLRRIQMYIFRNLYHIIRQSTLGEFTIKAIVRGNGRCVTFDSTTSDGTVLVWLHTCFVSHCERFPSNRAEN